jgi:putative methyltransferase
MDLYAKCAYFLKRVKSKKQHFKTLLYNDITKNTMTRTHINRIYKIVLNTARHYDAFVKVIEELKKVFGATVTNVELFAVLLYEQFIGKDRCIKGGGALKKLITTNEEWLKERISKHAVLSADENLEGKPPQLVRKRIYIRAIVAPEAESHSFQDFWAANAGGLSTEFIQTDDIIPNLISLPYDIYKQICPALRATQQYIVQGRSSCMPAYALLRKIQPGWTVLDACSAPGNKTLQLMEYNQSGKVIAVERDQRRFDQLKRRLQQSPFSNIKVLNSDFLHLNPNDKRFRRVRYILLDPSCSGSGMLEQLYWEEQSKGARENQALSLQDYARNKYEGLDPQQKQRVKDLSKTQEELLLHALKFPNVVKIAYSTCSIYTEEDELVVQRVLSRTTKFQLARVFNDWPSRGFSNIPDGDKCIRFDPRCHETDGFFVALFKRVKESNT